MKPDVLINSSSTDHTVPHNRTLQVYQMTSGELKQGVNQLLYTLSRRWASLPDRPLSTHICPCLCRRVTAWLNGIQVQYVRDLERLRLTTLGLGKFSVCVCICQCVHAVLAYRLHIQSWCQCSSNRVAGVCIRVTLTPVSFSRPMWANSSRRQLQESEPEIDLSCVIFLLCTLFGFSSLVI